MGHNILIAIGVCRLASCKLFRDKKTEPINI